MDPQESARLLMAARRGSREALSALFERYGERLLALIRARLGPRLRQRLESRDILQETLLKTFKGLDRFHGTGSRSLMAWMGTIAQTVICDQADFYRRKKRDAACDTTLAEGLDPVAEQIHTEVSRLHLKEESRRLEEALDSLSESHRSVRHEFATSPRSRIT